MRFARFNKTIILFIALSIAIHLCLLGALLINGSLTLPNKNSFRLKISLERPSEKKDGDQKIVDKSATEKLDEISSIKDSGTTNSATPRNLEPPPQQSNGWGATKGSMANNNNSISERSALQSRLNTERQQRLNAISGNVAQLMGQLSQEPIAISCALWISQEANKGYLKCSPEHYQGQVKFRLSTTNIEWVYQSDLPSPAMCIPIRTRDAHAAC